MTFDNTATDNFTQRYTLNNAQSKGKKTGHINY